MESFLIQGGTSLSGTVRVSGSMNSAVTIVAACLMASGKTLLKDVPNLDNVGNMWKLLGELGCHLIRHESGDLTIEVTDETLCEARQDVVKTFRASICVLGPLLARRGKAIVSISDGTAIDIDNRPFDLHARGLEKLGANFQFDGKGNIIAAVNGRLKGCKIYVAGSQGPTVLGTINLMCAAALAEGETVLTGAALDPEVSDCAIFLNKMGAKIQGYGTSEIRIEGVERLTATEHQIMPDRIEAGTLAIAAAISGGELILTNCNLDHLTAVVHVLEEVGLVFERKGHNAVSVKASGPLKPIEMTTHPYPGFPTDLQAQLMALLCFAEGRSVITEGVFPNRFDHIGELNRMGAEICWDRSSVIVQGVKGLTAATVMASDFRASAALVLAALAAKGQTKIDRVYHIDRGYKRLDEKLNLVRAQIMRVNVENLPKGMLQVTPVVA